MRLKILMLLLLVCFTFAGLALLGGSIQHAAQAGSQVNGLSSMIPDPDYHGG
jgi:hypothetical protein